MLLPSKGHRDRSNFEKLKILKKIMLESIFDPAFADSVARISIPILLAALGGAICQRAGVFNIALEGFLLMGAFMAVFGSLVITPPS